MKYFTFFFSRWAFEIQCMCHARSTSHCRASRIPGTSWLQVTTFQEPSSTRCVFDVSHCGCELGCFSFSLAVSPCIDILRLCYWAHSRLEPSSSSWAGLVSVWDAPLPRWRGFSLDAVWRWCCRVGSRSCLPGHLLLPPVCGLASWRVPLWIVYSLPLIGLTLLAFEWEYRSVYSLGISVWRHLVTVFHLRRLLSAPLLLPLRSRQCCPDSALPCQVGGCAFADTACVSHSSLT